MSAKCYCGVDPGLSGAIALMYGTALIVYDVPTIRVKVGKTFKRRVDAVALAKIVAALALFGIDHAMTENVNGWSRSKSKTTSQETSPDGQSASAAFAFGKVTGHIEQALACNGVPYSAVAPAAWKRAMGLIGAGKDGSRALAAEMFPQHAHLFARVKDDGRAEAALLAKYLERRDANA